MLDFTMYLDVLVDGKEKRCPGIFLSRASLKQVRGRKSKIKFFGFSQEIGHVRKIDLHILNYRCKMNKLGPEVQWVLTRR